MPLNSDASDGAIELRVQEIAQLFHTLDPFPFRERDLDAAVEDYIIEWARELRSNQALRIIVHLPSRETSSDTARKFLTASSRS